MADADSATDSNRLVTGILEVDFHDSLFRCYRIEPGNISMLFINSLVVIIIFTCKKTGGGQYLELPNVERTIFPNFQISNM